jgi:4-amino-4-deoxy-L-arabinose transferase-like glycosyltransferase
MIKPPRSLIVFVLAITLVRLAAAAVIPLSEDEAYYRLWAEHLQLGYLDHPPMIAWWVRAGMSIAGDTALGVRLMPALSAGLASLLVFDLARTLGAVEATASRAVIWFNATLLIGAGGALAVPDAPNILFWTASLACLARTDGPRAGGWWIAAGAAAGLATLSKYSALFIAPGVFLWLLLKPKGWRVLLTPWPWAAGLVAAALFGLNVAWNAEHQWVTFSKQFGRAVPGAFAPENLLVFLASQAILITPSIAWFGGAGALAALGRRAPRPPFDLALPLATSAPFLAYLLVHGLHDRVEAHWPAPLYPAIAIVAAAGAEMAGERGYLHGLRDRAAPIGLAISALILLHLAWPASDIFGPADPALGFRGWPDFARHIEAARLANHAAWVGTLSYGTTAELAASGQIHAPIIELRERDRYPPNDASWRADLSQPGLVVDLSERVASARLGRCFTQAVDLAGETRGDPGKAGIAYAAQRVSGGAPPNGDCGPKITPGAALAPQVSG